MIHRFRTVLPLFLLALALAAVACAPPTAEERTGAAPRLSSQPPPVPGAARKHAGVRLRYYGDAFGLGTTMDAALVARFQEDTGIQVDYIRRPSSASESYALYNRFFQAGSGDMDVMMLDVIWPGAFADHLLDLNPYLAEEKAEHLPQLVANNTVDGRLVAMPEYVDMGLLFYRKDLLEKYGFAGPPRTWQELERMARTIQEGERPANPRFYGYVWQGYTYEGLTCNALEWQVSSGGGRVIDPKTRQIEVSSPRALAAFQRAASWVGTISPLGVTSYQESESLNLFRTGNAAFMRNWPYAFAASGAEGSAVKGRFWVTWLPRDESWDRSAACLGGWQLSVSRYTRNPDAAAELVRYWTCAEVQAWRAKQGSLLPTIPAVYERKDVQESQGLYGVIPEVLPYAVARPSTESGDLYNEVSAIYFQGVAEILQGGDAEFAAAKMERDLKSLMDYLQGTAGK